MLKYYKAETQQGHSRAFYSYIKKLSEVASKHEEATLIEENLQSLKNEFKSGTVESEPLFDSNRLYRDASQDTEGGSADMSSSERHAKEAVVRLLHAEMTGCGQQALAPYTIHAVNLISSAYLLNKKTGYTAVRILVDPEDALYYLTVACVQRDLKSDNYLEVAAALDFVRQALRPELLEVVTGDLQQLQRHHGSKSGGGGVSVGGAVGHPRAMVRKKVVEAMHAIYAKVHFTMSWGEDDTTAVATSLGDASAVFTLQDFRQALCDQDPTVMDAGLRFFCAFVSFYQMQFNALYSPGRHSPAADAALRALLGQVDLVPSFLNILRQVIERRLPNSYDYHHTPSPWMQMRLLFMISTLTLFSYSYDMPTADGGHPSKRHQPRSTGGTRSKNMAMLLQVVEMLKETMQRADNGMYIGFAIICEVVFATARLLPVMLDYQLDHAAAGKGGDDALHSSIDSLLVLCSEAVTKFLASKSPNVRLSGIQALCFLSQQQNLYFHYLQKASLPATGRTSRDAAGESYFQENYKRLYMPHQMQVMECLSDYAQNDFMTQKCAVTLLFSMSNAENSGAIFSRLLLFIQQKRGGSSNPQAKYTRSADVLLLNRLVLQTAKGCLTLIKTFAKSPMRFVNALNKLMLCVPDGVVSVDTDVQLLLKLLIESEVDAKPHTSEKENGLRRDCVFLYYVLCGGEVPATLDSSADHNETLVYEEARRVRKHYKNFVSFYAANNGGSTAPEGLYRIGAWVMGEYGYLLLAPNKAAHSEALHLPREKLLNCLMDMFERSKHSTSRLSSETKCWLVTAMLKVVSSAPPPAASGEDPRRGSELRQEVVELLEPFTRSRNVDLQQRCCEAVRLLQQTADADPAIVQHVLPPDGNCLPVSADVQLYFLSSSARQDRDSFIQTAMRHGARPYDAQRREELVRRYAQYTHDRGDVADGTLRGSGGLKTAAYAPSNIPAAQRRGTVENTFVLNTIDSDHPIAIDMPHRNGPHPFLDFVDQSYTQGGPPSFRLGGDGGNGGAPCDYAEELVLHAAGAVKRWGISNLTQDGSHSDGATQAACETPTNRLGGGREASVSVPSPTQHTQGSSIGTSFAPIDEVASGEQALDLNLKKDKFMSDIFGFSKQKRKKNRPQAQTAGRGAGEGEGSAGRHAGTNPSSYTAPTEDLLLMATRAPHPAPSDAGAKKDVLESLFSEGGGGLPAGAAGSAELKGPSPTHARGGTDPLVVTFESTKIDKIVGGYDPWAKVKNITYFVFTICANRSVVLRNVQLHFVTPSVLSVKRMNADNLNTFRVVARNVEASGEDRESFHKTTLEFAELKLSEAPEGAQRVATSLSLILAIDPERLTQLHVDSAGDGQRPLLQVRSTVELPADSDHNVPQMSLHTSLPISWIDVLFPVCTRENERILNSEARVAPHGEEQSTDCFFDTTNFGKAWGLLARGESVATVTLPYTVTSGKDPLMQRFVKELLQKIHLGIVEVIDEEVIAAAVLLDNTGPLLKGTGTPSGEYFSTELLLCHCMWDKTLRVTVRSRNKDLSLVVLAALEEKLV